MGSTEKLSHPTRLSLFCFVGICVNHQSRVKNRRDMAERCANEGIDYARSSVDKKNGFPMKDIALHPSKSDATVCWSFIANNVHLGYGYGYEITISISIFIIIMLIAMIILPE